MSYPVLSDLGISFLMARDPSFDISCIKCIICFPISLLVLYSCHCTALCSYPYLFITTVLSSFSLALPNITPYCTVLYCIVLYYCIGTLRGGADDIVKHPWFAKIDFNAYLYRKVKGEFHLTLYSLRIVMRSLLLELCYSRTLFFMSITYYYPSFYSPSLFPPSTLFYFFPFA